MSIKNIQQQIANGESETLEFKASTGQRSRAAADAKEGIRVVHER